LVFGGFGVWLLIFVLGALFFAVESWERSSISFRSNKTTEPGLDYKEQSTKNKEQNKEQIKDQKPKTQDLHSFQQT
jgi:hypothetical protein